MEKYLKFFVSLFQTSSPTDDLYMNTILRYLGTRFEYFKTIRTFDIFESSTIFPPIEKFKSIDIMHSFEAVFTATE